MKFIPRNPELPIFSDFLLNVHNKYFYDMAKPKYDENETILGWEIFGEKEVDTKIENTPS